MTPKHEEQIQLHQLLIVDSGSYKNIIKEEKTSTTPSNEEVKTERPIVNAHK